MSYLRHLKAIRKEDFDGQVLLPDDADYHWRRQVWNAMIENHPKAILVCASVDDVISGIRLARELDLELGIRCGGHSILGHSVPDGGFVLDLRGLAGVYVDPNTRVVYAQGGSLLGAIDNATMKYGLATTTGNVSHTGVGGLTLGGGMGWLGRKLGLTSDNLLSCDLVTADGRLIKVSDYSEPELFWALRGGGGNFGVVTEFRFRVHPTHKRVISIESIFHANKAYDAMIRWRDISLSAPREIAFVSEVFGGRVMLGAIWLGDMSLGYEFADQFCEYDYGLISTHVNEISYLELQRREDDYGKNGLRRYWKGFYLDDLTDDAIRIFLEQPTNFAGSIVAHGGAIRDRDNDATAFSHRHAAFEYVGSLDWTDPAEDAHWIDFGRSQSRRLEKFSSGTYVNTVETSGVRALGSSYSISTLQKLRSIKRKWDSDNVFHMNHNISPEEDVVDADSAGVC